MHLGFGPGSVELGGNGGVLAVRHPGRAGSFLLSEDPAAPEAVFHESAQRWGTGFVIAERSSGRESHRFDTATALDWRPDGVDVSYRWPGLELTVARSVGSVWTETYELRNTGTTSLSVGSLAVSTPWRDAYFSAADSLRAAVHAHVWTGGRDSWVWAQPMDGSGPGLGLVLTEGRLDAYSVESRDVATSSNIRGHLYLHVTDHARNPDAMGGQRPIVLAPGESYRWSWQLDWYADLDDFTTRRTADRPPLIRPDRLAVEPGASITLGLADGATSDHGDSFVGSDPGVHHVWAERDGDRSRVAVLVHPPLRTVVETRIRFALDHQRASERADVRRAAFVPYDNSTGLTVLRGAWPDWNDSRERVGTAQLLQQALRLGWGDRTELVEALRAYEEFVRATLLEADGLVADDSRRRDHVRPYNLPWFARFLLDQGDLDTAVAILDRYYADGGAHFLAFDLGPLLRELGRHLQLADRDADAARMRDHLLGHAAAILDHDEDLPAHEVNYEQSMVAPLVELLLAAHLTDPAAVPAAELTRRLGWLTAFAADQPDVRMRNVPIRHWDGYWFGALRMWGDVYPHYWSWLSATVFLAWPESLASPEELAALRRAGEDIHAANLTAFYPDGSATCAFVYPSCVNGQPAHLADPLANDQDWALVYALRQLSADDAEG